MGKKNKKKNIFLVNIEYFFALLSISFIRALPLSCAYSFNRILSTILYYIDFHHRKRAIQHILHAGVRASLQDAKKLALASFIEMGKIWVEIIKFDQFVTPENVGEHVKIIGDKKAVETIHGPVSVIWAAAHLGNWEISGLSSSILVKPIVSIARRFDNEKIGNYILNKRKAFKQEMEGLLKSGVTFDGRFEISTRAHLIFKYHCLIDGLKEHQSNPEKRIGTTKRGIGPTYGDKAARRGIRALEMLDMERFEKRFREEAEYYNAILKSFDYETVDIDAEWNELKITAEFLKPYIKDTVLTVNKAAKAGKKILFEGAQGMLLDVDYGTYPFVTSSNTTTGGACTGSGLSPKYIDEVYGVMKAYCTRVGEGPFPTELFDEDGKRIAEIGHEFGATTGRPRRCGWFDAVSARYSCMVNGTSKLAITKLDVLDSFDKVKVCTAYEIDGVKYEDMPSDTDMIAKAKPVYEEVEGWKCDTSKARSFDELPVKARTYLTWIAGLVDAEIGIVSVGPKRSQTFDV